MTDEQVPSTASLSIAGVLLAILGFVAIAAPALAGQTVVMIIGIVLLIGGIVQVVSGLRLDGWSNKLPPLVMGAIATVGGLGLLGEPWIGMTLIALLLAIFFVLEGICKIIASFSYRPASGWLLMLASGGIALMLGLMIWQQWPVSGLWAVGILVGVDLLSTGISMVALAFTIRQLRNQAADEGVAGDR